MKVVAQRLEQRSRSERQSPPVKFSESVTSRKDEFYREGYDRCKLDVPERGRPGLVSCHCGGWRSGSKNSGQWTSLPADFAAKGYMLNY